MFFCSVSWGNDCEGYKKMPSVDNCGCKKQCEDKNEKNCKKNSPCSKSSCTKDIDQELMADDDEYCVYNQCYFDKQFRDLKRFLCLTRRQEMCIDNLYRDFKADMERLCAKYRCCKNELLEIIECEKGCEKDKKAALKEIKKEQKAKLKDFDEEIKEQLCKNQRGDYRKFKRQEVRKMRKIIKYAKIYKFPCVKCCSGCS